MYTDSRPVSKAKSPSKSNYWTFSRIFVNNCNHQTIDKWTRQVRYSIKPILFLKMFALLVLGSSAHRETRDTQIHLTHPTNNSSCKNRSRAFASIDNRLSKTKWPFQDAMKPIERAHKHEISRALCPSAYHLHLPFARGVQYGGNFLPSRCLFNRRHFAASGAVRVLERKHYFRAGSQFVNGRLPCKQAQYASTKKQ